MARNSALFKIMVTFLQGIKLRMDDEGNILIKPVSSSPVFIRDTGLYSPDDNCLSSEVTRLHGQLECDKAFKVPQSNALLSFSALIMVSVAATFTMECR